MKPAIYISGIGSFLLLLAGLFGLLAEIPNAGHLLIAGGIVLLFVYVPLMFTLKYQRDRAVDKIMQKHRGQRKLKPPFSEPEHAPKGWDMNNSPFRERKSGLTWGGGTISHTKADRNTRRSFLRRS